ncbi:MAG: type 2 isopentenyl-diphosphate Delta-isomerase [Bacteroidales bacterium]|nr:MAG: type 2 isopentenyl-diphosphate Delta-isomerase [Bacteroidales bacterium]
MEERKKDHIRLAFESQMGRDQIDMRFNYEPLINPHLKDGLPTKEFMGKTLRAPMWVSSMTGGTKLAYQINRNLARACHEFGMGMGLGSCRILLDDDTYLKDFDVRDVIGDDLPLYANLGIAQIEKAVLRKTFTPITDLLNKLRADGLIIHVNPMQESLQPEGDILTIPPIRTISSFMEKIDVKVVVKEVGQGMGPESLKQLLNMPLEAIEFAAFGGTNFARLELLRSGPAEQDYYGPLANIGHDAYQMVEMVNRILEENPTSLCQQLIISGGIKSFLDGYFLMNKVNLNAVYGQASAFLKFAKEDYDQLRKFVDYQIKGLELATAFLTVK